MACYYLQKDMIILHPGAPIGRHIDSPAPLPGRQRIPLYVRNFHASRTNPAQIPSPDEPLESDAQHCHAPSIFYQRENRIDRTSRWRSHPVPGADRHATGEGLLAAILLSE
jgi:hypothetical protein